MNTIQIRQYMSREKVETVFFEVEFPTRTNVELAEMVDIISKAIAAGATHVYFSGTSCCEESDADDVKIHAINVRDETDEEMNKRIQEDNNKKRESEEYEKRVARNRYEALKKQYGF